MSENVEIKNNFFHVSAEDFKKIPGSPIAYWVNKPITNCFTKNKRIKEITAPKNGMRTGDNSRFLRNWQEVQLNKLGLHLNNVNMMIKSAKKWVPYNKGGEFRKWYGNNNLIVNWENNGLEIKNNTKLNYPYLGDNLSWKISNEELYFKESLTWSSLSSGNFSIRFSGKGALFDTKGYCLFPDKDDVQLLASFLNSKVANLFLNILCPTLDFSLFGVGNIPYFRKENITNILRIKELAIYNISLAKSDWDLRETSWDFLRSPLLTDYSAEPIETVIDENLTDVSWPSLVLGGKWGVDSKKEVVSGELGVISKKEEDSEGQQLPTNNYTLSTSYSNFTTFWTKQFKILHKNEEELNRIFIDLYELQDELKPDVPYNEITILQSELEPKALKENKLVFKKDEILKQFVSYGVGCIFGRYSLDKDGLVLANSGDGLKEYLKQIPEPTFMPDKSGILPITDENDFANDLTSLFKTFLKTSFGHEHFQENLRFVEDAIGKDIRRYFIKDFYKDHVKRYKKRPIYWMISSPSGAFKALIYLHRYTKDTISIFLNDYLRPYLKKLKAKVQQSDQILISANSSNSDKTKAQKDLDKLRKVIKELELWERDVVYHLATDRIELDLDDGVKVNYAKLGSILEKVKGLNG